MIGSEMETHKVPSIRERKYLVHSIASPTSYAYVAIAMKIQVGSEMISVSVPDKSGQTAAKQKLTLPSSATATADSESLAAAESTNDHHGHSPSCGGG